MDESELDNGDETTDLVVLTGSESGLAGGNAGSGDRTRLGDSGDDGDGEDVLSDCGHVVDDDELEGCESGLRVCEGGSEDRVQLGSCDG